VILPKILSLMLVLTMLSASIILVIPVSGDGNAQAPAQPPMVEKGEGFTHDVLLELFVTTSCQYCPSAEAVAKQLNMEYGEHFVFVTMVMDDDDHGGNGKARDRSQDYVVEAVPDGVFDGGYKREVGGQSDTSTYEGHIEDCGNRDVVANVELSVEAVDNGDGTMAVSYTAKYLDQLPFFDAHLRVYIAEKASRWPDKEGHPIPYGFIDYAFDKDVRLPTQMEMTESVDWRFDDYENATFQNFVVIAALFDKSSGVERYVVQSATTETTNIVIWDVKWDPLYPENYDDMTFRANVTGDVEEVELEYSLCTESSCGAPQYVSMEIEDGTTYVATAGDFGDDSISIHFKIIAKSPSGEEVKSELVELEFGGKSGTSDSKDEWVENGPVFYSGLGLILVSILLGVPLMSRREDERSDRSTTFFEECADAEAVTGEEEYVDSKRS